MLETTMRKDNEKLQVSRRKRKKIQLQDMSTYFKISSGHNFQNIVTDIPPSFQSKTSKNFKISVIYDWTEVNE